jgi:hypothetical protein
MSAGDASFNYPSRHPDGIADNARRDYFVVVNSPFKNCRIKNAGAVPISWTAGDDSIVRFVARRKP